MTLHSKFLSNWLTDLTCFSEAGWTAKYWMLLGGRTYGFVCMLSYDLLLLVLYRAVLGADYFWRCIEAIWVGSGVADGRWVWLQTCDRSWLHGGSIRILEDTCIEEVLPNFYELWEMKLNDEFEFCFVLIIFKESF